MYNNKSSTAYPKFANDNGQSATLLRTELAAVSTQYGEPN